MKLCHIGGYELMQDGTQEESVSSLKELCDLLDAYEIEYDKNQLSEFPRIPKALAILLSYNLLNM